MAMDSLPQAAAMVALFYLLPGYVAWMAVGDLASLRRPVSLPTYLFTVVLTSTLWTGWLATMLLQGGKFSLRNLVVGTLLVSAGFLVWCLASKRVCLPRIRRPRTAVALLGILLILATVVFLHPHEFVTGGADAGVYVSLAGSIVDTGGWVTHSSAIAAVDAGLYATLFRQQPPDQVPQYIQFPGFYLTQPGEGEITPQFFPLHPLWMAVFNAVGGVRLSLYTTPLWGLLGVWAVAMVAGALFGKRCGMLSLALLTLTATQIWFSRYPTSEVLTQYLLFGGMWALIRYLEEDSPWYGFLAGAALGQSLLARLDLYFLVAIPLIYSVQRLVTGKLSWRDLAFVLPFGVLLGQSLVFATTQSWPYFSAVYGRAIDTVLGRPLLVMTGLGALCVVAAIVVRYFSADGRGRSTEVQLALASAWSIGTRILAVAVILAALYAYFVRPVLADTSASWYYWYGDSQIPNVEPYNLVRLGWYLTPLGLILAAAGVWYVLRERVTPSVGLLLGMGLFFSALFIANSRNNPHHIYVMRRYVPVVIPFLVVMMAYALDRLWRCAGWRRVAGAGLALVLAGWLLSSARLQLVHIEYDGLVDQIDALVAELGSPPAIILFNDDAPISTGALLGTPLNYLYGYTAFDLQEEYAEPSMLAEQVASWRAEGRRVLIADGPNAVPAPFLRLIRTPLLDFHATYPVLEASYEHKPRLVYDQTLDVAFYEVVGVQ